MDVAFSGMEVIVAGECVPKGWIELILIIHVAVKCQVRLWQSGWQGGT